MKATLVPGCFPKFRANIQPIKIKETTSQYLIKMFGLNKMRTYSKSLKISANIPLFFFFFKNHDILYDSVNDILYDSDLL